MAEFIVVAFAGRSTALNVLSSLQDAGEMEFNIEATALVARDDQGRILFRNCNDQLVEQTVGGAVAGGIAGLLIGLVTANPVTGLVAGSAIGGVGAMASAEFNETGLMDDFSREVGQLLDHDSSAICFLFWDHPWDELPGQGFEIIKQAGGKIIRTTLPFTEEELNTKLGWG